MQGSVGHNLAFAAAVCVVCAIFVSSSAVSLRDRQEINAKLDMQRNVLLAAGLASEGERLARDEIRSRFEPIRQVVIDLQTGDELSEIDPAGFDQRAAQTDPRRSRPAPENNARVQRIPNQALVYQVLDEADRLTLILLPVHGIGFWSTLYGFLALDADLQTIRGLTYYQHAETPGLGGEVDNPRWKALWPGRKAFGANFEPQIRVIKGRAGPPSEDPYEVDGLSGATMTSRGVTNMLHFWLGEHGFRPYLKKLASRTGT